MTQPYQRRVGYTLRRQTTMLDAVKRRTAPTTTTEPNFQSRQVAAQLRQQIPVRQQAHWSRMEAERKIRDSLAREALQGERRAILGYKTSGLGAPHLEARLREIEGSLNGQT
jgi:hypothetical protein